MTKRIKIILISLLTALCAFCVAVLALPPVKARADDITTTGISDGNFGFVPGASIPISLFTEDPNAAGFDIATANTRLRYSFKLENFDYENLAYSVPHPTTWWGARANNVFIYEFTLYRGNRDGDGAGSLGTADAQNSVLVVVYPDSNRTFYGYVAERNYYGTGTLAAGYISGTALNLTSETTYDNIATLGKTYNVDNVDRTFGQGYTITQKFRLSNNNLAFVENDGLVLNMVANVISPFQYYFVKARYCFTTVVYAGMFSTQESSIYGEVYSSSRSVANVLQRMSDLGIDFEETFGDRAIWANRILAVQNTRRVRIKYLTEIDGTPYATHKYAYVDVPVLQETIYINDVEEQLGISLRKCLDSNAYCFQKTIDNDGELYQLYYLKNVWLRAITVDGNFYDYFLDINESYKEIYRPYVNAEILNNDVYEWIYSTQIINKFPALQDYRFNEIYGYFGLVVVPETYTLNSALKTMFDVETSKIGVISNFVFERMLPYSGYQQLLSEYNYGFLSKVWSEVTGFVMGSEHRATYYVVYSEPGTENALIGEGGQTNAENPGSVVENEIIKPAGGVMANAWYGIIDFFGTITKGTKTILFIALGGVAVVGGIVLYKKLNKGSKRK
ncbi:MAG: hypothetical protein IJQ23_07955 [Clostridia bacterium]|nr:hypothetical protein [Clostridia bacterium]